VARADAGHAAREDFAALLDELRQDVGALVVDEVHLLDAELANFLFAEILALAAGASAGTAARATRTAFATRTAVTATGAVSAAVTTFTTRCAAGGLRLLLLLFCHNCLPF
jgi:Holliday junction resolvasome RuvABC ATP-dependent DNA helicase subunit